MCTRPKTQPFCELFCRQVRLAVELAPRGIRVNILTAGAVLTDAWKAVPISEARIAETIRRTPSGRLVTAEEIAYGANSFAPMRPQESLAIP